MSASSEHTYAHTHQVDDGSVGEGGVVGALEPAEGRVAHDSDRNEERRRVRVHAGEGVDGGGATEDQHGRHDQGRQERSHGRQTSSTRDD